MGRVNVIEYITIASTGNATDFGDLTATRQDTSSLSNSTRNVTGGGEESSGVNKIEFVTIATTGNATDFGDLTVARNRFGSCSSSTRGIWSGGDDGAKSNVKANDVLTIKQAFSIPKSADSYRYDILFINGPQCDMKF